MREINILFSQKEIEQRIAELAKQIERDYEEKEITVLCVLKGASFFAIQLTQRIKNKIEFEFIELSSYGNKTTSSGTITTKRDVEHSLKGKNVLIIEDIVDTGRTMQFLLERMEKENVESVKIATLLDKPERRVVELTADYVGFTIPNKFVLGYGMDYEEYYRNLPYIGYVE